MSKKLVIVWFAIIALLFGISNFVDDENKETVDNSPSILYEN